jgi:16S rRNA (cytosine967-C5)-methyltransferase
MLAEWFRDTKDIQGLERSDLVFPGFENMIDPAMALPCIEQFQQRPPTWIRVRSRPDSILDTLKQQGVACAAHPGLPTALSVAGGTSLPKTLADHAAQYVVQDIASQCIAPVCAPRKGEEWWDCCAGAGGKSLHLMDLLEREGKILATDIRVPALKELKKRARKYGIRGIRTQPHNAAGDEPFAKTFDGILIDAPCSGWGTWSRNPDARWRSSKRDVMQCANRQLRILNNVCWCTRPGGVLVYAVCTFTRPETEEVVAHFLDQNPEFRPDPFIHPLTGRQTDGQLQIWPWDGPGDAMFIARFVRSVNQA